MGIEQLLGLGLGTAWDWGQHSFWVWVQPGHGDTPGFRVSLRGQSPFTHPLRTLPDLSIAFSKLRGEQSRGEGGLSAVPQPPVPPPTQGPAVPQEPQFSAPQRVKVPSGRCWFQAGDQRSGVVLGPQSGGTAQWGGPGGPLTPLHPQTKPAAALHLYVNPPPAGTPGTPGRWPAAIWPRRRHAGAGTAPSPTAVPASPSAPSYSFTRHICRGRALPTAGQSAGMGGLWGQLSSVGGHSPS